MHDRIPGAPGQYKAVISADQLEALQSGGEFIVTLTRDDQPMAEGTPYNKESVLPDELAQIICPDVADPAPADALRNLLPRNGNAPMLAPLNMNGYAITGLATPSTGTQAANKNYVDSVGVRRDELLANTDTSTEFAAQNVEFEDLSIYDEFHIECAVELGDYGTYYTAFLLINGEGKQYSLTNMLVYGETVSQFTRLLKISGNTLEIGDCYMVSGSTIAKANLCLIPMNIFGIKYRAAGSTTGGDSESTEGLTNYDEVAFG